MFHVHVCMFTICMDGGSRGQKASGSLELEFQMVVLGTEPGPCQSESIQSSPSASRKVFSTHVRTLFLT